MTKVIKKPDKKVKVLFINNLLNKMGGAEKNLYDICLNINKNKFIPYVLAFKGGELTDKLIKKGIHVDLNGVSKIISVYALKKGLELYRFLNREKIQIVVTYHYDPDIWGGIIARLARVPVVISSRRDMGDHLEKKHIWFYRMFAFLFNSFISVSNAVKREIETREWIKPEKIETIHNGISLDSYSNVYDIQNIKAELGIDSSKIIIGMVASFRPIKGHIYLVEAVNMIVKNNPNIQVVIVGYNETEYFHIVKKRVDELKLQNYFVFTGDRKDVSRLLIIFDIFVISSINEGFSNALLEAMAAGKPVVVSNSGGNPESIEHQETGLLFKPCDSRSLAKALLQLIEDKNLRQSMGKKGLSRVKQNFRLDMMIKKYENLYQYHLAGLN